MSDSELPLGYTDAEDILGFGIAGQKVTLIVPALQGEGERQIGPFTLHTIEKMGATESQQGRKGNAAVLGEIVACIRTIGSRQEQQRKPQP